MAVDLSRLLDEQQSAESKATARKGAVNLSDLLPDDAEPGLLSRAAGAVDRAFAPIAPPGPVVQPSGPPVQPGVTDLARPPTPPQARTNQEIKQQPLSPIVPTPAQRGAPAGEPILGRLATLAQSVGEFPEVAPQAPSEPVPPAPPEPVSQLAQGLSLASLMPGTELAESATGLAPVPSGLPRVSTLGRKGGGEEPTLRENTMSPRGERLAETVANEELRQRAELARHGLEEGRPLDSVTQGTPAERALMTATRAAIAGVRTSAVGNAARFLSNYIDDSMGRPRTSGPVEATEGSLPEAAIQMLTALGTDAPVLRLGAQGGAAAARPLVEAMARGWTRMLQGAGLTAEEAAQAVQQGLAQSRSVRALAGAAKGAGAVGATDAAREATRQLAAEGKITEPGQVAKEGVTGVAIGGLTGGAGGPIDSEALQMIVSQVGWGLVGPLIKEGRLPTAEDLILAGIPAAVVHAATRGVKMARPRVEVLPASEAPRGRRVGASDIPPAAPEAPPAPPATPPPAQPPSAPPAPAAAPQAPVAVPPRAAEPAPAVYGPPVQEGYVRLYRGESRPGSGPGIPDWVKASKDEAGITQAEGRWFTPDAALARWYMDEAGKGGRLVYVDVPRDLAEQNTVSNLDTEVSRFSLDPENEVFLPADHGASIQELPSTAYPPKKKPLMVIKPGGKLAPVEDLAKAAGLPAPPGSEQKPTTPEPQPAPRADTEAHDVSSTQVDLPERLATTIRGFGATIPNDQLADGPKGREQNIHVTLLYGLDTPDAAPVRAQLEGQGPLDLELGKLGSFSTPEHDVLFVEVKSPALTALNAKLAGALPNSQDFPEYKPHVTIAYLKPGQAQQYVGRTDFEGQRTTVNQIAFHPKGGGESEALELAAPAAALTPKAHDKAMGELVERWRKDDEESAPAPPAAGGRSVPPGSQPPALPTLDQLQAAERGSAFELRYTDGHTEAWVRSDTGAWAPRKGQGSGRALTTGQLFTGLDDLVKSGELQEGRILGPHETQAPPAEKPKPPAKVTPQVPSPEGQGHVLPEFVGKPHAAAKPFTLPRDLAGAKPRYSYGPKAFTLSFESPLDMAYYIAAQDKPSLRDLDYLRAIGAYTGESERAIRAHGRNIREHIKGLAKNAEPGELRVPTFTGFHATPKGVTSAPPAPSTAVAKVERWEDDRGAIPGEPVAYLDASKDNLDDATAVIVNATRGKFHLQNRDGDILGTFDTVAAAKAAGLAKFPQRSAGTIDAEGTAKAEPPAEPLTPPEGAHEPAPAPPSPTAIEAPAGGYAHAERFRKIAAAFETAIDTYELPKDPRALRKLAADAAGVPVESFNADAAAIDDIFDALEVAVNKKYRATKPDQPPDLNSQINYAKHFEQYLGNRTRTIEITKRQQFSTPLPIAAAAAYAADVRPGETVLEPTAGTGNLLAPLPEGVQQRAIEIDPRRVEALKLQGITTNEGGYKDYLSAPNPSPPDVIITNPPWGKYTTQRYGRQIPMPYGDAVDLSERFFVKALRDVRAGGRVVGVMPTTILKSPAFLNWLRETHTLRALVQNPPGSYATRGTDVESVILVADKGKVANAPAEIRGTAPDWDGLADLLRPLGGGRPAAPIAERPAASRPAEPPAEPGPAGEPGAGGQPEGVSRPARPGRPAPPPDREPGRQPEAGVPGLGGGPPARGGEPGADVVAAGAGRPGADPEGAGGELRGDPGRTPELVTAAEPEFVGDVAGQRFSVADQGEFEAAGRSEVFAPAPLRRAPGVNPHPRLIVKTRSLAGAKLPVLTYDARGQIIPGAYERKLISDQQLDYGILPALQANQNGHGFLSAADVGVGKTRIGGSVIAEWFETGQAKRVLYVTASEVNVQDVLKEYDLLAGGKFPFEILQVRSFKGASERSGKEKEIEPLPLKDKAVYLIDRYNLASYRRALEGVGLDAIVGDEAHLLKNAEAAVGQAWMALQSGVLARQGKFLYLTATPAVDLGDLEQFVGLREWAPGGFVDWVQRATGTSAEARGNLSALVERLRALREQYDALTNVTPEERTALYAKLPNTARTVGVSNERQMANHQQAIDLFRNAIYEKTAFEREAGLPGAPPGTAATVGRDPEDVRQKGKSKSFFSSSDAFAVHVTPAEQEQIMRELVMKNKYDAIDLWRAGVEFEVVTQAPTRAQSAEYEEMADFFHELNAAFYKFGRLNKGKKKTFTIRQFLQQEAKRRMFDYRLGPAIEAAKAALARGEQPVISTISVSEQLEDEGPIPAAINTINARLVETDRDTGEVIRDEEIPEALVVRGELLERWRQFRTVPSPVEEVKRAFGEDNVAVVTGDITPRMREKMIREFQEGTRSVALISGAGKTGISLHHVFEVPGAAKGRRHLIVTDYEWSATTFKQELGRVDRSGQISAPKVSVLSTGAAGEKKFLATIANRMRSLGALSKGSAESASNDKISEFEIGGDLDTHAMREAYRQLPADVQEQFMSSRFRDSSNPEHNTRSYPSGAGLKDFLLDLQFMPPKAADQAFTAFWKEREKAIAEQEEHAAESGARTRTYKGTVLRSTPLRPDLTLHELKDTQGHIYGVLQGIVTPHLVTVARHLEQSRKTGAPVRRYIAFQAGDRQITGLEIRKGAIPNVAASFGQKVGRAALETPAQVLEALGAGDRVPLQGGQNYELRMRPSDRRIVVEGAKMADRTDLLRNGAAYAPVGNFFFVPEDKLAAFLARFPVAPRTEDVLPSVSPRRTFVQGGERLSAAQFKREGYALMPTDDGQTFINVTRAAEHAQQLEGRDYDVRIQRVNQHIRAVWAKPTDAAAAGGGGEPPVETPPAPPGAEPPEDQPPTTETLPRTAAAPQTATPTTPNWTPGTPVELRSKHRLLTDLAGALNATVRFGRFRQRASGVFKAGPEVIRLRSAGSLVTAAHEIGHFLHKLRVINVAGAFRTELAGLDPNGTGQAREGLAEFVSLYVVDPNEASRRAPGFLQHFEQTVGAGHPDILAALQRARDGYATFLQSPLTARVMASTEENPSAPPRGPLLETFASWWDRFYAATVDDLHPLKVLQQLAGEGRALPADEAPYLLARLIRGVSGVGDVFVEAHPVDYDTMELRDDIPGLREIFNTVWQDRHQFDAFLQLRRAQELLGSDQPRLQRAGQSLVSMWETTPEEIADAVTQLEAQHGAFTGAADDLQRWNDALLDYLAASGRFADDAVEAIKAAHRNYAPLYRVFDNDPVGPPSGRSLGDVASPVKRLKGSERAVVSPMLSFIRNAYAITAAANRNEVVAQLADLMDSAGARGIHGLGKFMEQVPTEIKATAFALEEIKTTLQAAGVDVDATDLEAIATVFRPLLGKETGHVQIYRDGAREVWWVDPWIYKALAQVDRSQVGLLVRLMAIPARMLRAGVVNTPDFLIANLIRDQLGAAAQSKTIPFVDAVKGLLEMVGRSDLYRQWQAAGGQTFGLMAADVDTLRARLRDVVRGDLRDSLDRRNPLDIAKALVHGAVGLTEYSERPTRVGAFRRHLEQPEPEDTSPRAKVLRAAYSSREASVDFARRGSAMTAWTWLTAFLNPGIQGTDRMFRAIRQAPARVAMVGALMMLAELLLYLWNRDKESYQQASSYEKDLFNIVASSDPEGTPIKIPRSFEWGVLFGAVPRHLFEWIDHEDPEALKNLAGAFAPLGFNVIPTAAVPVLENYANWSVFRGRRLVPKRLEDVAPGEQATPGTTELARRLGRVLNYPPVKIDNLLRGYTGSGGYALTRALDSLLRDAGRGEAPDKAVADYPFLRRFVVRNPNLAAEPVERFYDYVERAREAKKTRDLLRKDQPDRLAAWDRDHVWELAAYKMLDGSARRLGGQWRELRQVENHPTMGGAEKRERSDAIAREIIAEADRRVQAVHELRARFKQGGRVSVGPEAMALASTQ